MPSFCWHATQDSFWWQAPQCPSFVYHEHLSSLVTMSHHNRCHLSLPQLSPYNIDLSINSPEVGRLYCHNFTYNCLLMHYSADDGPC